MLRILVIAAAWIGAAAIILVWFRSAARERARGPIAPPPGSRFTLGGRGFRRPLYTSNAQDDYLIRSLRAAGIAEPNLLPGETPDIYVERLFAELHDKGAHYALLAAVLIRDGDERWNEAGAAEVAEFLSQLEEPEDKERYYALLGEVLRPFCMSGLGSWLSSRTSGSRTTSPPNSGSATSPAPTTATGQG